MNIRIHCDANLHREQELLVSCILSARLLWEPRLFLDKGKDREGRCGTRDGWEQRGRRGVEDRREV